VGTSCWTEGAPVGSKVRKWLSSAQICSQPADGTTTHLRWSLGMNQY